MAWRILVNFFYSQIRERDRCRGKTGDYFVSFASVISFDISLWYHIHTSLLPMSDIHPSRKSNFKQQQQKSSHVIDSGAFEKLETLFKDNETTLNIPSFLSFLQKGFGTQLTQTWSYYSHVNDHNKFISCTISLTKLVKILSSNSELIASGVEIIKDVLVNYTKVIYRALTSLRAGMVNTTLRLLNEFIVYSNGALVDDFFSLFDFQLAVLPKLLAPTKTELSHIQATKTKEHLSIRYCFIRFLLNFLKFANSVVRKDFITANVKIFSAWFKHLAVIDSDALIRLTLSYWSEFILNGDGVSKTLKIKVFNEWNIIKLIPLYHSSSDKELRAEFNQFLLNLFTDAKTGIPFPCEDSWFSSAPSTSSSSSTILVNGKNFKCNNKIIYSILTNLKPWDDDTQLQLIVSVLQSHGELIPPYMNYIASRGLHDPKLTGYWLGQTLLLSKVIRLQLPEDIIREEAKPASVMALRELVVPSVLSRGVLAKCIISEISLIRQLSNQLVLDCLDKLTHVLEFLNERNQIDLKVELVQAVYASLPDLATVCSALNDNYTKQPTNKMLLLTNLMIISKYISLFNDTHNYSNVITKPYMDLINGSNKDNTFSNIDLVLLDQFFKLQQDQASQFKWWMKSGGSEHTLFTSLLKITCTSTSTGTAPSSSSTTGISVKIEELLETLSSQTVIFNTDQLKSSPITPLLHSLRVVSQTGLSLAPIYKVIDETISRAVKTPFKYLDRSNEVQRVSVFIVTLLEQWKFLDRSDDEIKDNAERWLGLFLRYAVISGESLTGIETLLETSVENRDSIISLMIPTEEDSKVYPSVFATDADLSYADVITITPLAQLSTLLSSSSSTTTTIRPTNEFDILSLLTRVAQIMKSDVQLKQYQNVLNTIMTQFGDFMFNHPHLSSKFSHKKYWEDLFLKGDDVNEVSAHVSQVLSEIFQQLPTFESSSDFASIVLEKLTNITDSGDSDDISVVLAGSVWCLSSDDLRSKLCSSVNAIVEIGILRVMLERKLTLSSNELVGFVKKSHDSDSDNLLVDVLNEFVKRDLIVFGNVDDLLEASVDCKSILKELLNVETLLPQLIEFACTKNELELSMFVFSQISPSQFQSLPQSEQLQELTNSVTSNALSLLKSQNFAQFTSSQLSNIFVISSTSLTPEDKDFILEYYLTTEQSKYSQHVTSLITSLGLIPQQVKTWVNKSVLYLTKIFAEFTQIPQETLEFLESFQKLMQKQFRVTTAMNKLNLNALLEVIFTKWIRFEPALEFCSVLLACLDPKVKIDSKKLLQILINNEDIPLNKKKMNGATERVDFLTVIIIWKLFNLDVSSNSTLSIRDQLLQFYTGSTSASDLLVLNILESIESKLGSSWIDSVFSWDLIEGLSEDDEKLVGSVQLIEKKKEGFLISLNKRFISNGLANYQIAKLPPPKPKARWVEIEQYFTGATAMKKQRSDGMYYDPMFLTLLIINNEELVKLTTVEDSSDLVTKINVKKLIDFDLLQTLILNLSSTDENLFQITLKILSAAQSSLDDKTSSDSAAFKDSLFVKLYLTKILYTFHTAPETPRTPLTFHLIAQILPILNDPAHNLYEKAYRWVTKSPQLHPNDIPLYVDITSFNPKDPTETHDVYYKNISWLLENVIQGLQTEEDFKLIRSRGFIEWALNLQNSPYVPMKLKYQLIEFLSNITELESGTAVLISRYAGLLNLEQEIVKTKDLKTNKDIKKLQNDQYLVNLKQLGLKYGIVACSNKRIREWTEDEVEGLLKRCAA